MHSIHKRKLARRFPHKKKWIYWLDKSLIVIAVIAPLVGIPQILEIHAKKSAGSVSIIAWTAYALLALPWLVYGIAHKEKPIIISSTLYFILNSIVVASILIYL